MEDAKDDIRKKYPSLPPNYVSLAQLQERWIQQKQKETEQKEQIASENQQQPNENNGFNGSPQSSKKNGVGRIHAQGLHVSRNGEVRVDGYGNMVSVPRRQSDENRGQIREAKSKWKSKKSGLRASGDAGGSGMGNAEDNQKKRRPRARVKKGVNGGDLAQTLSGNGEMSEVVIGKTVGKEGYPGYENKRVHEIVGICTVGLAPEIKGKEKNPVGFGRKPRGKEVVDGQFSSSSDSRTFDAKSRGKQVVDGQFYCSTDDRRPEANYHGKEAVNDQFLNNTGVVRNGNEYKVEVPTKNGSEVEVSVGLRRKTKKRYNAKYERYKRSGNDKGLLGERNVCKHEVLQDNEEEKEEVSWDEKSKTGKERLGSRFKGNEPNWRMNRNSDERQLKIGQQLVEEDVFMGKKESTSPEAMTGKGARAYGNEDRGYHWIASDFRNLSFRDSREGNSSRGRRGSYGNFGLHRKGKQVDGGLVWVKKEEKSDSNAEIL